MDSLDNIFLGARAIDDPDKRAAYLAESCGADTDLRERIETMLRDAQAADAFFASEDNATQIVDVTLSEKPGTVIGRYKLLEKIGEGGMGIVYMAEQREPVIRKVALKIIKLGMDTRQVVARFEAERQALALMDHPNIAKVLDGGATESGRPYFVMELVNGLPITKFCDQMNLPTRERLDLFLEVCSAIQHAHQKGIIHRDIKPSNILVTMHGEKPVPKVIDFGIAKATSGQQLTDKTLFTQFQHFMGTPAYVSPEQTGLSGLDIDTRSDVYSLGVLLYELLTGKTPFDGKELLKAGLDEMRRTICEVEPVKPSTRLTQDLVAAIVSPLKSQGRSDENVRADARRLLQEIRGDLDWIVMKCLEKDRTRRYETANGLARDIQRHLNNEPVVARPPNKLYILQKTVRRNRIAIAATVAIIVVLANVAMLVPWQQMKFFAQNWQARIGAKTPVDNRLVIIGIDKLIYPSDFSDEEMQREPVLKDMQHNFPWSRAVWARLIEKLSSAGAKVIVFDLSFSSPYVGDDALHQALDKYKDRVVIGYSISVSGKPGLITLPSSSVLTPVGRNSVIEDDRLGYLNLWPDFDDILRRASYRLTRDHVGNIVPKEVILESLGARALRKFGRPDLVPPGFDAWLFRYTAPANQAYNPEPVGEVLSPKLWEKNYDNGRFFKDKIVIIGATAEIFHDTHNTPFTNPKAMSGPEVHLQIINAALHGEFLSERSSLGSLFIIAMSGVMAGALRFLVRRPGRRFLSVVGLSVGYAVFAQLLFNHAGQVIPLAFPLLVLIASSCIILAYDFLFRAPDRMN